MRWDVEWPRIALCDTQFEYFDQKIQRKSTFLGNGPKKTFFCHNYLTQKQIKQLYEQTITCATTLCYTKGAIKLFLLSEM